MSSEVKLGSEENWLRENYTVSRMATRYISDGKRQKQGYEKLKGSAVVPDSRRSESKRVEKYTVSRMATRYISDGKRQKQGYEKLKGSAVVPDSRRSESKRVENYISRMATEYISGIRNNNNIKKEIIQHKALFG